MNTICDLVDEMRPDATIGPRRKLIKYVDRSSRPRPPLRDRRSQDRRRMGWQPSVDFEGGSAQDRGVVSREHASWIENVRSGAYLGRGFEQNYEERIAQ